jgi:outer membrane lipoprotein SlyB
MPNAVKVVRSVAAVALIAGCGAAWAQTSVSYGRITSVNLVTETSGRAQAGGALVGGALGLISGSGQSGSNRALRGIGGAVAGQQVGRLASRGQAFEYTILIDGRSTVTMVTDEAGLRVGDCVAVERGAFNNLRLVDDSRCNPPPRAAAPSAPPAPAATAADVRAADACIAAKEQLLAADSDDAFDRAERRVRLLCAD